MSAAAVRAVESLPKDPSTALKVLAWAKAPKNAKQKSKAPERLDLSLVDPDRVVTKKGEWQLRDMGIKPIGSRRRRLALDSTSDIPFEQLPYQCFQEARKILQADREKKLEQITAQREKLARVKAQEAGASGGERAKEQRIAQMSEALEKLKILADINDPLVKRKFEDGTGNMSKPVYRHLARRKWESYRRKIIDQRISQFFLVPDILPELEVTADVRMQFGRHKIEPGAFVPCILSSKPPDLDVQVFDAGERLVTVAVVDPDVPNLEKDRHDYRCHFLAANIPISPINRRISLEDLTGPSQLALSWLPPFAQKGDKYHRLAVFVLEQEAGSQIDVDKIVSGSTSRNRFLLRSLLAKEPLKPIGAQLFRTKWDESTATVMANSAIPGANIELRRRKVLPMNKPQLPLKKMKNRNILPSKRLHIPKHKGSTPPVRKRK